MVEQWFEPWHIGTHLTELSESFQMNTNMIGFAVVKIDSSPPVRFYQKYEWASESLCLLDQKVC